MIAIIIVIYSQDVKGKKKIPQTKMMKKTGCEKNGHVNKNRPG